MKKLISIDDLEVGMETSTAVVNKFGQVLLGANSTISNQHINILKTWGIVTIEIHISDESRNFDNMDKEAFEKIKESLLLNTGWLPRNPFEEDLFEMAAQCKYEKQITDVTGDANGIN